jgi:hypothetical protein
MREFVLEVRWLALLLVGAAACCFACEGWRGIGADQAYWRCRVRIAHVDAGCLMTPEDFLSSSDTAISMPQKEVSLACGEQLLACGRAVDCSCYAEPAP